MQMAADALDEVDARGYGGACVLYGCYVRRNSPYGLGGTVQRLRFRVPTLFRRSALFSLDSTYACDNQSKAFTSGAQTGFCREVFVMCARNAERAYCAMLRSSRMASSRMASCNSGGIRTSNEVQSLLPIEISPTIINFGKFNLPTFGNFLKCPFQIP